MALTVDQIVEGSVAEFCEKALHGQLGQQLSGALGVFGKQVPRSGPFLCLKVEGGCSLWAAITTHPQKAPNPFEIKALWKQGGKPGSCWGLKAQFLHGTFYYGPNSAFVGASAQRDWYGNGDRPKVDDEGMEAVQNWWRCHRNGREEFEYFKTVALS